MELVKAVKVGRRVLTFWLFAEVLFYIRHRILLSHVQRFVPFPEFPRERRVEWFRKMFVEYGKACRDNTTKQGCKEWLTGWNSGRSLDTIMRGHIEDFFAQAFFHRLFRQLGSEDQLEVTNYVNGVEELLEHKFIPGKGPFPDGKDPLYRYRLSVRIWYRPMILYFGIFVLQQTVYGLLRFLGFSFHTLGHIRFWHRKPSNSSNHAAKNPFVFFHGICPGTACYLALLRKLWLERELFIVELPWVAMQPFAEFPDQDEFCRDVDVMLAAHHHEKAVFLGHSYGTFVCKWMHMRFPRLFEGMVLLDPVSILIFAPFVTANFLFAESLKSKASSQHWMMFSSLNYLAIFLFHYFASRELGIAKTVTRHIVWYNDNFFADELPVNTTIILSGKDMIVPSPKVERYISRHNENCLVESQKPYVHVLDGVPHGGMLLMPTQTSKVADIILTRH
jgi:pimeloyl-ACP methyl ester carboxylesterase